MANKNTKASTNMIDKIISSVTLEKLSVEYQVGEDKIKIGIANDISIAMRGQLVKDIVNMVFVEGEDGNKVYAPYLKKFASRYCILTYFTDINLPTATDKIWAVIEYTTIYDDVVKKVGVGLINEILAEADDMIAFEKEAMLKNTKMESLFDGLNSLVSSLRTQLQNTDLKGLFDELQKQSPKFKDGIMDAVLRARTDAPNQASNLSEIDK